MNVGVIIARFQTPYLHEGHKALMDEVADHHDKLIIVLGVCPVRGSRRNPYDYFTREKMIKREYPEVVVLPLSDHPSDAQWSENLDNVLVAACPAERFALYGSRDSFIPYYSGRNKTVELPEHGDHNASELRQKYADKVFDSQDFRAGILYAYHNQYPKVYPTVDIAVFKNGGKEILLGKKPNNMKWRLIGGYVDPTDENLEEAALRELEEEAGPIKVKTMTYFMSTKVDDWRYRSEVDKIITTVFKCEYVSGEFEAQDDICELAWHDIGSLKTMIERGEVTPEHVDIIGNAKFIWQ
ncbi:MAG: bifunctional NMN adenylyltransferase/nudix hydrolase [Saprospiraceae bacterium]|jgi:bifunctional NMN adenylyltransferase/nudix hydrolase